MPDRPEAQPSSNSETRKRLADEKRIESLVASLTPSTARRLGLPEDDVAPVIEAVIARLVGDGTIEVPEHTRDLTRRLLTAAAPLCLGTDGSLSSGVRHAESYIEHLEERLGISRLSD